MNVTVFGATDTGLVRKLNEDNFLISGFEENKPSGFCILADGMGGHNAGEVASGMATEIIANELLASDITDDESSIVSQLTASLDYANNAVYEKSLSVPDNSGMGTTTVVAYISNDVAYVANIGDSRAYLIESENITQITVDHSIVQKLLDSGSITPQEARNHPEKNIITKALGTEPYESCDIYELSLRQGDKLLLCSDGLSDMLEDNEIKEIINEFKSAEDAVNELIVRANAHGGKDNITAVLICFDKES